MMSVHAPSRPPAGISTTSPRRRAITAAVFFLVALSWSPLLPGMLGVPFSVALFGACVVLAALTAGERGLHPGIVALCMLLLSASLLLLLLSQSQLLLLRTAPLPLLIFAAWQTSAARWLPARLCHLLTTFLLIGVAGAVVGLVYALGGGQPILSIVNIDGRENELYLTTMSNYNFLGVIRPSFIYDEPGAFSFILCATVALREVLGLPRRPSYLLLIGGLVTFSLIHLLITLIYFAFRFGVLRTSALVASLLVSLAPVAVQTEELEFFVSRFSVEDGQFAGDNRSNQLENFFAVVHPSMLLFGDVECHSRAERVCEEHGDITSSPATPTYRGGVMALLMQLGVHAALVVAFWRSARWRFSALAMTLMLLQRPYFDISGYGFITVLLIFLMLGQRSGRDLPSLVQRDSKSHLLPL